LGELCRSILARPRGRRLSSLDAICEIAARAAEAGRDGRHLDVVIYQFPVGRLDCAVLSDGQPEVPLEPPLASFFTPDSGVPEGDLTAAVAAEGAGRHTLTCGYNCLLVTTSAGQVVIDSGLGPRFLGYGPAMEPLVGKLGARLTESGSAPTDLAAVIFTHLHQDHSRGATWSGDLTFPDATGYAHVAEVEFWSDAARPAGDPHLADAREAIRLFGERLHSFQYDTEILPGIRTVGAAGHTPGHTAFLLESQGQRLLVAGDSFYDPLQLSHPAWRTPWDHNGDASVASRRNLLRLAADENLLVHAYHLPYPGLGYVSRHGEAYRWHPANPADPANPASPANPANPAMPGPHPG
jgi:glyoxylase-like metal-dependent hydrolase (beta-lactamase superfamily II)